MWEEMLRSFGENPRDVQSRPIIKRTAKWFYVYAENGKIYVDCAREKTPSSSLSQRRMLSSNSEKCDMMYDIYLRRKRGEPVSAEATAATVNQIYWYGIFADMGY